MFNCSGIDIESPRREVPVLFLFLIKNISPTLVHILLTWLGMNVLLNIRLSEVSSE